VSSYQIIVTLDHAGKVTHHYATESDARFQYSEWRGQGVDCKLVLPHPEKVFLAWTTEVTEYYRTEVEWADLPESVQAAMSEGMTILDIDRSGVDGDLDANLDLWGLIVDHEESPYNEEVTDRSLNYDRIEAESKR
jgi:hypothetical protein